MEKNKNNNSSYSLVFPWSLVDDRRQKLNKFTINSVSRQLGKNIFTPTG